MSATSFDVMGRNWESGEGVEPQVMSGSRILVVEDESIVAVDLQNRLQKLGHEVPAICSTGEDALKQVGEVQPDLVLMDIMLKGAMKGTEAAEVIRTKHEIPVVYLTAYSDPDTLNRAKVTEPYGYLLKPFDEVELNTAILMAIYKHRMDQELRHQKNWLDTILSSINDAVITTDRFSTITYMNPAAEALTAWIKEDAVGHPIDDVFRITDESTGAPLDSAIASPLSSHFRRAVLRSRLGQNSPITHSAAPMNDASGHTRGFVITFQRRSTITGN